MSNKPDEKDKGIKIKVMMYLNRSQSWLWEKLLELGYKNFQDLFGDMLRTFAELKGVAKKDDPE